MDLLTPSTQTRLRPELRQPPWRCSSPAGAAGFPPVQAGVTIDRIGLTTRSVADRPPPRRWPVASMAGRPNRADKPSPRRSSLWLPLRTVCPKQGFAYGCGNAPSCIAEGPGPSPGGGIRRSSRGGRVPAAAVGRDPAPNQRTRAASPITSRFSGVRSVRSTVPRPPSYLPIQAPDGFPPTSVAWT
jgi:hypothetical protein